MAATPQSPTEQGIASHPTLRYWTVLAATLGLVGALLAAGRCSGNTAASNTNGATGPALIMKVSYNRGADLMTCLSAVKMGSTHCAQGLVGEVQTITGFGIPTTSVYPFDGAGSNDQGRTTPAALAQFLKGVDTSPYGTTLADALPVLGRSGTMANVLPQSPAAGQAQVKTGNRVLGTAADQIIVLGNSLAGYIHTKSGRQVTFMIAVGNVPTSDVAEVLTITNDQARMVESVQQSL